MAVYQVGADGKAPAGLKVGDEVVTNAGTYKITNVKADGSYDSNVSNKNQTTSNFGGVYSTPGVRTPEYDDGYNWSGNGASGYYKTQADYAKDTTDYAQKMLDSQSYDEFKHWESQRNNKAAAQGIDLSGSGVTSNEDLYQKWKETVWPTTAQYAQWEIDKANAAANKANASASGMQTSTTPFVSAGNAYGGVVGSTNTGSTGSAVLPTTGTSDYAEYLKEMYNQNLQAELNALKSAYDQNVAELDSQNDMIAEQYRAARNQAAAQNELQRQQMNEYALASGLNTGTSGQAALAQSAVYQGNLGNLWAKEAQTQADVDLQKAQLLSQLNSATNQATANSNALLSQALYEEMIRQDNLRREAEAAALKQQTAERDFAYEYAMTLLGAGVMPDVNTLQAAGILGSEASALQAAVLGQAAKKTGSDAGSLTPTPTYSNGGLSQSEVAKLQADINKYLPANQQIAVDGIWGPATAEAAGGMTADQYASIYYKQNSWSGRTDR